MTEHSPERTSDATGSGEGSNRRGLSRRAALGAIGLGGAAVAVAACSSPSSSSALLGTTTATMPTGTVQPLPVAGAVQTPFAILSDPSMNYDLLTVLGSAAYQLAEVGEVLTAGHTITTAGVNFQNYVETFLAWGDQLAVQAAQFSEGGDPVGAAHDTLRASNYYQSALFFVLGTTFASQEKNVYQKMRATWDQAVPSLAPVAEPVQIPYEGSSMQGWFFAPDRSGRKRPTLIVNNGSDGQEPWVWGYGGAAGLEYGWNTLLFDGPGQGSSLFLNEWPFRYDWENVITPVIDFLVSRSDVDAKRIALSGGSMGGELIARAAAFEHRLAAIVCAPGCVDPWAAFPASLTGIVSKDKNATNAIWVNDVIPNLGPSDSFNLRKRLEPYDPAAMAAARAGKTTTDFWTPAQIIIQQKITEYVKDISCPTLVINYDDEQFYPGQSQQMYDLLKAPKEMVNLTEAQGAQMHCSPMAPQRQNDAVFAWLDSTVGSGIPAQ